MSKYWNIERPPANPPAAAEPGDGWARLHAQAAAATAPGPDMSEVKGHDTSYEWKIILILSLTFGLVGLDRFILPVLFPAFMEELGLTYEDLGNLVGILDVRQRIERHRLELGDELVWAA